MKTKTYHPAMYWVHLYGYFALAAAIYGILVAFVPVLIGHQWSLCWLGNKMGTPCVFAVFLYDGFMTMLSMIFGFYSIRKASLEKISLYKSLLMILLALQFAFFTFECVILIFNAQLGAQAWESFLIGSIALVLLGGIIMGLYVNSKVISLTEE